MQEAFGLLWRDYKYKITSPQPANNARSLALLYEESPPSRPDMDGGPRQKFRKVQYNAQNKNEKLPTSWFLLPWINGWQKGGSGGQHGGTPRQMHCEA